MDSRIPDGFHVQKFSDVGENIQMTSEDAKNQTIAKLKADEIGKGEAHKSLSQKLSDFRELLPDEDLAALNELLGDEKSNPTKKSHASKNSDDALDLKTMGPKVDEAVFLKPMQKPFDSAVYLKPMQKPFDEAVYLKPMQKPFEELES